MGFRISDAGARKAVPTEGDAFLASAEGNPKTPCPTPAFGWCFDVDASR